VARIRTVKPEFWVDEKVVELGPWARLLFIGLWNFADDQGYIDYAPKRIKMQVFPGDTTDVVPLIDELLSQGVLRAYRSSIGPVLHVVNWRRHQRVDHPAKARFDASRLVPIGLDEPSRDPRETLARPLGDDSPREPSRDVPDDNENGYQQDSRAFASDDDEHLPRSPDLPQGELPGFAEDPREDSRTLAPEGKGKEGKGKELKPVPPSSGPRNGAAAVVAAYIDGAVAAGHPKPSGSLPARVGRDAKRLLDDGLPLDKLTTAATAMGAAGWHDLAVQLQRDSAGRNGSRASPAAWTNYDDQSRYDKPLFRTEPSG
jgi:hypothetical protein